MVVAVSIMLNVPRFFQYYITSSSSYPVDNTPLGQNFYFKVHHYRKLVVKCLEISLSFLDHYTKLEKIAINDALPLIGLPDAMPFLTFKIFLGPRDISGLISMVSFTFTMRRRLILLAS